MQPAMVGLKRTAPSIARIAKDRSIILLAKKRSSENEDSWSLGFPPGGFIILDTILTWGYIPHIYIYMIIYIPYIFIRKWNKMNKAQQKFGEPFRWGKFCRHPRPFLGLKRYSDAFNVWRGGYYSHVNTITIITCQSLGSLFMNRSNLFHQGSIRWNPCQTTKQDFT